MDVMTRIFWNPAQHRLRAGWRILLHLLLFAAITVGRDAISKGLGSTPIAVVTATVLFVAGGLGLAWVMARRVDRRSLADFGLHLDRNWWMDLIFGLVLGALLMTGVFCSLKSAGWISITGPSATTTGLPIALAFLLRVVFFTGVAFNEELAFRGYELKNLSEGFLGERLGARGAIVFAFLFSSAIFGAGHASNENATIYSTLTVFLAGLLIALPYLLTGQLAIPIGLHLTWNLFQGPVYGFPVSGNAPSTHLFSIEVTGPEMWTGGVFGAEAGLMALVWALVGCGLTVWWIKARGRQVALHLPLATWTPRGDA